MTKRLACIALILASAAVVTAAPATSDSSAKGEAPPKAVEPSGGWPKPRVLVYGDDKDVPLPLLVGGSDLVITDWTGDGLPDVIVSPGGPNLILRRNIGTKSEPRFANVYKEEISILDDKRMGRFFAMMHKSGVPGGDSPRGAIIAFTKQEKLADISKVDLKLNLFVPQGKDDAPKWNVIPALNTDGTVFEGFKDAWVSPAIETFDWNGDGKDDVLVGCWQTSISQTNGKYTAGFNNPDDSWVGDAGRLYLMINASQGDKLMFEKPALITTRDGKPIKAYGAINPHMIDIDGDGKLDLVLGSHKPGIQWYRNVGTPAAPAFEAAGEICDDSGMPIESVLALRPYFGDLNGDGRPEMIGTSYFAFSMGLWRFDHDDSSDLSKGWKAGGYLPMQGDPNTVLTGQGISSPEVVDWNGDGETDLLIGSEPCAPMVTLNSGTPDRPIWSVPQRIKYVDGSPVEYHAIEVGRGSVWGPIERYLETVQPRLVDWDGDGTLDILTGAMGARTLFLKGKIVDGQLRFEKPIAFTNSDGLPRDVAHRIQVDAFDFDGDGKLDLVDCDTDNIVTIWKGDGTTTLGKPQQCSYDNGRPMQLNPSHMTVTSGRRCLKIVDWNLDGTPDLISFDAFGETVWGGYVRLRLGVPGKPAVFAQPIALFPILSHHQGGIALIDWDGDGLLDIVTGGDHTKLGEEAPMRGQFYIINGKDLPVPPAKRQPMPAQRAVPLAKGSNP